MPGGLDGFEYRLGWGQPAHVPDDTQSR
jgi:hypothetical protein